MPYKNKQEQNEVVDARSKKNEVAETKNKQLNDEVEKRYRDGIYKGTYSYDYAVNQTTIACTDTDSDGVIDVVDIDDDNDGLLDTNELTTCESPSTFTFKNSNGSTTGAAGYNASFPSWMQLSFNQFQPGYTLTFDQPVEDIALQFASIYDFDRYGNFTVKLSDGTIINNVDFDLSTSYAPTAAIWTPQPNNVNNFTGNFSKNYGAPFAPGTPFFQTSNLTDGNAQSWGIVHFKNIPGASTKGIVELTFTILESTATSGTAGLAVYSKCVSFLDTDTDGIPNRLDLDSDGDGCPDAKEASIPGSLITGTIKNGTPSNLITTANVASAVVSDTYGANGFADTLETASESGVYSGMYSYEYVLSANMNACLDSDNDGVNDVIDIDDDNDGILDSQEQVSCFTYGVNLDYVSFSGTSIIDKTSNSITTNSCIISW
jgi:hypothetical protein